MGHRVAIIHDWLLHHRGGEKVLEALCELYPEADLYTLFYRPEKVSPVIKRHRIFPSFLNRLPWLLYALDRALLGMGFGRDDRVSKLLVARRTR